MERLTEKFKDGRNILRKGISDVFHVGFGRFFEGEAVDRLEEYEDLEEQGKLLELPCAVGDKLFVVNKDRNNLITEENVYDVQYRGEKYAKGQRFFMNIGALAYFEMDFGKIVFLTREKAEAALKEMENKE